VSSERTLLNLQHVGFCRSQVIPITHDPSFDNYVEIAKFNLCELTKTLWKDPVWEKYTDEEILIEYFAHLFQKNKDFRAEFEEESGIGDQNLETSADWFDEQIKKNEQDLLNKASEEAEDDVSLDLSELG